MNVFSFLPPQNIGYNPFGNAALQRTAAVPPFANPMFTPPNYAAQRAEQTPAELLGYLIGPGGIQTNTSVSFDAESLKAIQITIGLLLLGIGCLILLYFTTRSYYAVAK